MAQAVEDVVETKVVGKRVKEGHFRISNGAGFEIERGGRGFKSTPRHMNFWFMEAEDYRELAAELTAIADAMEFGEVKPSDHVLDASAYVMQKPVAVERSETPLVFTVRSEGWPRLGLYNSGALAFFHTGCSKPATVLDPRGTHYEVGRRTSTPFYNPLPKDGVLIHQQEGDSSPKLGLSNMGSLVLFETPGGAGFMVHQTGRGGYRDGERVHALDYNPLPAGGVLLKPEV